MIKFKDEKIKQLKEKWRKFKEIKKNYQQKIN